MSLVTNWFRWLGRSLLALIALVVVLALVGSAYQILGNLREPHRFPQRGRSVQVGNLKLNIDCSGHADPTVILESGMGVPGVGWAMVQPEVAKLRAFVRMTGQATVGAKPGRSPEPACRSRRNFGRS